MPSLTINFTPVAGATGYEVCYKPSSSPTYICQTITAPPLVISTGITCNESYDVGVRTICSPELTSPYVSTVSNVVACVGSGTCYTFNISTANATSNFIKYTNAGGTVVTVAVSSFTLVDGFYQGSVCSAVPVVLVNALGTTVPLTGASTISTNGVVCTSNGTCSDSPLYKITFTGKGATACSDQTHTIWSTCPEDNITSGCILYTSANYAPFTESIAWIAGLRFDVNPATGQVIMLSGDQC